jgi:hypothetical protein
LISFLPQQIAHNLFVEVLKIQFHFVTSGIRLLRASISPMAFFFTKVAFAFFLQSCNSFVINLHTILNFMVDFFHDFF